MGEGTFDPKVTGSLWHQRVTRITTFVWKSLLRTLLLRLYRSAEYILRTLLLWLYRSAEYVVGVADGVAVHGTVTTGGIGVLHHFLKTNISKNVTK